MHGGSDAGAQAWAAGILHDLCLSYVSRAVLVRAKGKVKGSFVDMCRDRWKDRMTLLQFIYTPVFAVS